MSEISVRLQNEVSVRVDKQVQPDSIELSLIRRVANGDEQAFVQLIAMHGDEVARLIGRLTGWHVDSDDIFQDVLLVVWQRADRYKGEGSLIGWMKRIAVNRCRNHFRRLGGIQRKLRNFAELILIGSKQSYESSFDEDGLDSELNKAMQKLNQTDRSLLILFYIEEWEGADIAKQLGIRHSTLHVRLHRARKKLEKFLIERKD